MENETEEVKTSLWNKKQDDLTVGDSVKVGVVVTVVMTVAPLLAVAVAAGTGALYRKMFKKSAVVETVEIETPETPEQ